MHIAPQHYQLYGKPPTVYIYGILDTSLLTAFNSHYYGHNMQKPATQNSTTSNTKNGEIVRQNTTISASYIQIIVILDSTINTVTTKGTRLLTLLSTIQTHGKSVTNVNLHNFGSSVPTPTSVVYFAPATLFTPQSISEGSRTTWSCGMTDHFRKARHQENIWKTGSQTYDIIIR